MTDIIISDAQTIEVQIPGLQGPPGGTLPASTDGTFAANSDSLMPTQKATKTYIDGRFGALDVFSFKGAIDASANPNYPAANAGDVYKITVAGKIGGVAGVNVEAGDTIFCTVDSSAAGSQAAVGANWGITQANIDGAVVGPASATDGNLAAYNGTTGKVIKELSAAQVKTLLSLGNVDNTSDVNKPVSTAQQTALDAKVAGPASAINASIAVFNGTTGKIIQDSGYTLPVGTIVGTSDAQTLTTKTFNTANNTFTLNGAAFGTAGQATAALDAFVGDSGSGGTKGLVPAPITGDATKFLRGDGTFATPTAGTGDVVGPASVTDGNLAAFNTATGKLIKELTPAQVRTLLALVIGTNVQAWDGDLDAIAALTTTSFGRSVLTQADAAALRTLAGSAIGTNVQAWDADLDSIAALATTSFGRSVLTQADAAALRTLSGSVIGTNVQEYDATLAAWAAYNTNGILTQTAADTFTGRTITGTANQITMANGDGVSGNPTVSLPTVAQPYGKQAVPIPAGAMKARTTNGSVSGTVEMTTNKNMFSTQDFDPSTQQYAQIVIPMPKSWNEGTITFQVVWSHPSTTTNFGVMFSLAGVAVSDGDAGDAAFGTVQTSTDTGGTTNTIYISPESSAITIAGSPAAQDMIMLQLSRVVADAADTMAVAARVHAIIFYITTDAGNDA